MTRLIFASVSFASLAFSALPAAADYYHEAPWCAVRGMGKGVYWDCQYRTFEACQPTVLSGNRGWCNPNPYFVADEAALHRHSRKHHMQ